MSAAPAGGKVWVDGVVVDAATATVPAFDRGFLYGDSVYEVTRTYGGAPMALDEHLARLLESGRRIGMAMPPVREIEAATRATARAVTDGSDGAGDAYLRIIVTRGSGPMGLDPALGDAPRMLATARSAARTRSAVATKGTSKPWVRSVGSAASISAVSPANRSVTSRDPATGSQATGRSASGRAHRLIRCAATGATIVERSVRITPYSTISAASDASAVASRASHRLTAWRLAPRTPRAGRRSRGPGRPIMRLTAASRSLRP